MPKFASGIAGLLLILLTGGAAFAASGTAVGVDPDAEARGKQVRTLAVGSDIFIGDRVVTDTNGLVQILFDDNTRLVVGPKSSLLIEDYLLRDDGSAGKLAINALSGTFRFITGGSKKSSYIINTPAGHIGVRGTAFDFYVTKSATYVLQLHGATINCARGGDCETLSRVCGYGVLKSGGVETSSRIADLGNDDRRKADVWFRFARSQGQLIRQFRVSGAERCLRPQTQLDVGPPASLSDGPLVRRPRNSDTIY